MRAAKLPACIFVQKYKMMQLRASLSDRPPYRKFLIIVGLTLIGAVSFTAIGAVLSKLFFGVDMTGDPAILNYDADPQIANAFRMFQALAAIGTFILPAWLSAYLFSNDGKTYLGLNVKAGTVEMIIVFVLLLLAIPFINWMMQVNSMLHLPSALKSVEDWMIASEEQAAKITKLIIGSTAVSDLLINLLVVAILPAIGEELLFRGVIQKQFIALTESKVTAVVLTSFLFSALHMQFFGFLPRFVLGLFLGFIYIRSGSIWLSIAAHFFNNAVAVVLTWLVAKHALRIDPDTIGLAPEQAIWLGSSVFFTWAGVWLLNKRMSRRA